MVAGNKCKCNSVKLWGTGKQRNMGMEEKRESTQNMWEAYTVDGEK